MYVGTFSSLNLTNSDGVPPMPGSVTT